MKETPERGNMTTIINNILRKSYEVQTWSRFEKMGGLEQKIISELCTAQYLTQCRLQNKL